MIVDSKMVDDDPNLFDYNYTPIPQYGSLIPLDNWVLSWQIYHVIILTLSSLTVRKDKSGYAALTSMDFRIKSMNS